MKTEIITKAFPVILENEILVLLEKISLRGDFQPVGSFTVKVNGELLEVPYRIYFEVPNEDELSEKELLILNCFFTRHHNGFTRQKCLEQIILYDEYWITPFITQLLGEYVFEILVIIKSNLEGKLLENMIRFSEENSIFFETTKRRIVSYWNCYYRAQFPIKEGYVGFKIVNAIEEIKQASK